MLQALISPTKLVVPFISDAPTPQPTKRKKRKAPIDLEAEAEEHQKRREEQYQSLLAPSPVPLPMHSTPMPVASTSSSRIPDHSLSHYPAIADQHSAHQSVMATNFGNNASGPMSELENMGYDQVCCLYEEISNILIRPFIGNFCSTWVLWVMNLMAIYQHKPRAVCRSAHPLLRGTTITRWHLPLDL